MRQKKNILYISIGLFVIIFDQVTKTLVRKNLNLGESKPIFDNVLYFTNISNTGATWGILKGNNMLFIFLSVICLGLLIYSFRTLPKPKIAIVLIIGGIIGNLTDRVLLGYVTDFIDLKWWPVFNVADSLISIGITLIFIKAIKDEITLRRHTS